MIVRRIQLNDGSFADISANRQRFVSVGEGPIPGIGQAIELAQSGESVCRRVVSHVYARQNEVILSLRPLTNIEKAALPRDAAPDAPAEGG